VQLDDVADDRETEPEARVQPRRTAVRMAEAIEHERQHARIDAFAGVGDHDRDVRGLVPEGDVDPAGVNLIAFAGTFQMACSRRARSPITAAGPSFRVVTAIRLAVAAG